MHDSDDIYYFADEAEKTVEVLYKKGQDWFESLYNNGYLEKLNRCKQAYYGAYGGDDSHEITFTGEQGELACINVNHFRNIARITKNLIGSARPAFKSRAINKDYKSRVQTTLANNLLEFYMREKNLETVLDLALETSIVFGSAFVKLGWNSNIGQEHEVDSEGRQTYHGDVEFTNLTPFDVVFDPTKDTADFDWVVVRSFKNKYDLAATYPEKRDDIVALKSRAELYSYSMSWRSYDETVDIPVYEAFHARTASMPKGRYILYLEDNIILHDSDLPYKDIPVYRISDSDIIGTPYGYASMFDLLPMQDALNQLHSAILSNHNAFAVQNVFLPMGSNIQPATLAGGLNIIEGVEPPQPLNLVQTPAEIFNHIGLLTQSMETISGINPVTRGNAAEGVTSGNALALLNSQALQFISGQQKSYIYLIENVGTCIIRLLRQFASTPRLAAIVGVGNRSELANFQGDELCDIDRVIVEVSNPLSQTMAGKVSMAEQMLQMGLIKTPQEYVSVIETGRLDIVTDPLNDQMLNVQYENESLADGKVPVRAIAYDNHAIHVNGHAAILADPAARSDEELGARVTAHIQEHITLARTTDPDILVMLGIQPVGPEGGTPVGGLPGGMPAPPQGGIPPTGAPEPTGQGSIPQPATPPPVNDPRQM